MQITDLVGQTKQLLTTQTENAGNTKTVGQAVSVLQGMAVGEIFEGTVLSIFGKSVTLALSDGQHLSAKLAEKTMIHQGKSMFFQVKAHLENQIQIRPFTVAGEDANYTHVAAVKAAGLPVEAEYLSMVDKMMEEQMPIDKNSVVQMARLVQLHPSVNPRTVVELTKLQFPLTQEVVSAFENYKLDRQAIGKEIESLVKEVTSFVSTEDENFTTMLADSRKIIQIFCEENQVEKGSFVSKEGQLINQQMQGLQEIMRQVLPQTQERAVTYQTMEQLFTEEQQVQLNDIMLHMLGFESEEDMQIQMLLKTDTSKDMLKQINSLLENVNPDKSGPILRLLTSPQLEQIMKDVIEHQWFMLPEDLAKEENPVQKLYEDLQRQLRQIEDATREVGPKAENLQAAIKQVQANVEFMNQVNQMYSYVQIPLKMSGNTTSGELYVYTNRKTAAEQEEELSAFLHLDMEHLGVTDVSVKMKRKEVDTKFYMEDDESYALMEQFLPVLQRKIEQKGYTCRISAVNEEKKVRMVEDFLKQDLPPSGQVRRYSFDMRA